MEEERVSGAVREAVRRGWRDLQSGQCRSQMPLGRAGGERNNTMKCSDSVIRHTLAL